MKRYQLSDTHLNDHNSHLKSMKMSQKKQQNNGISNKKIKFYNIFTSKRLLESSKTFFQTGSDIMDMHEPKFNKLN